MPNWTKEQQEAIEKSGSNIIVSAGAGSGKTAVLSERILEKVKQGVKLDSLLVLTFTDAAAFEMKARIKKKILEEPTTTHLASDVDSAYITTFDSYALSIVRKYHYLLNIDKNINIIDKSILKLYKSNTLDEIFEELYKNKDSDFLNLIANTCQKNDLQLKKQILEIDDTLDKKIDKENFLDSYLSNYVNENYQLKIYDLFSKHIDDLVRLSKEYYDSFLNTFSEEEEKIKEKFVTYYTPFFSATSNKERALALVKSSPSVKDLSEETTYFKSIFQEIISKKIKPLLTNYPSKEQYIIDYNITKNWYNVIISILKKLNYRVNKYKKDNLFFDFVDIAKMSINCLKENPIELEKLKNSLHEILLDEYQDTNDLQEEFISLIANNNVYMVGDIKQSIYRFRNANPSIFMNKYENYKVNKDGIKIDLMKNFRSRNEVVDAINLVFNPIMSLTRGGADYKLDHIMHFGNKNYINTGKIPSQDFSLECPSYVSKDCEDPILLEIFYMAKDILKKIESNYQIMDKEDNKPRKATFNDFAILIDNSNKFDEIVKIFNYFNIPIEVVKSDDLAQNSLIHTFSNILNLISLDNKKDYGLEYKLSFMSVGRSFVMNMSDNELAHYIIDNTFKNTSLFKTINKISQNIEIKSNSMLIEEIINEFDVINKLPLIGDIEQNLMRLEYIDKLAINYSNLNLNGDLFINKIKEVLDSDFKIEIDKSPVGFDSVKLMTIHKSKGLEYPVVYLPFLTSNFFISENQSSFMYSKDYELIIPFKNEEHSISKKLHILNEKAETLSEKIRLFYVALTRAREKLIIIRQNPIDTNELDDYKLSTAPNLNSLLNSIGEYLKPYTFLIDESSLNITKNYIYHSNKKNINTTSAIIDKVEYKSNNITSNTIESIHSSKVVKELLDPKVIENMQLGTKMHEIMESIDLLNPDYSNIDSWMINHIKHFLSLDILKGLDKAKIYKEYEFTFVNNNDKYHGIIDLLIEFDDKVLIIDYKLNDIDNEEYINQLSSYKEYIKYLNLNKEVHMYLFSFLENKIKEI